MDQGLLQISDEIPLAQPCRQGDNESASNQDAATASVRAPEQHRVEVDKTILYTQTEAVGARANNRNRLDLSEDASVPAVRRNQGGPDRVTFFLSMGGVCIVDDGCVGDPGGRGRGSRRSNAGI